MLKAYLTFTIMLLGLIACGSNDDSTAVGAKVVTVDEESDSYIEDAEQNDNLTIVESECSLDEYQSTADASHYFTSEALGDGYLVESSYSFPKSYDAWTDDKYVNEDDSDECNSPGYRALKANNVTEAQANMFESMEFLYGCGGTCEYIIVDKELNADNNFTMVEVTWTCTNVLKNSLTRTGNFGAAIDKHVGSVKCEE